MKLYYIYFTVNDETKPVTFSGQHSETPNSNSVKAIPNIYSSIPTKDDNDPSHEKVCTVDAINSLVVIYVI